MLRQNMNASSQEAANCFVLTTAPSTATIAPATINIVGTLLHLDKSSGRSLAGLFCALILLFQTPALTLRNIIDRSKMAQLQGAQVSDNRPAVFHRHIHAVG